MAVQPQYHWQFNERQETTTVDTVNSAQSSLFKAALKGHGRIGNAIHLLSKDSHVNLGKEVGQFGTSDFTVAFGMKNISNHGDNELDIIGDQTMKGHGNFFSVRLSDRRIFFHVDENSKAKHYVRVQTSRLPMVSNRTWFHVAVVRKGRTIKIYIDGVLAAEAESKTGVANINNNVDVKLGHSRRGTPNAQYEDLRIYHTALSADEIQVLVPPVNRPLHQGEIELVAADNAAVILTQNVDDLSRFSNNFKQLRVANNTGVTLYAQSDFGGVAQKCYADLPDLRLSRLKAFPKSMRIWPTVGEPFTGKWIIKAPNGQYLSLGKSALTTAPQKSFKELFKFHHNLQQAQLQLIPGADQENAFFNLSPIEAPTYLYVDDSESLQDEFSIINQANNEWLELGADNTFSWTRKKDSRAVFIRVAKMADNEGQVGELAPGEVALYEHVAYHGKTWILSNSAKDVSGEHTRFGDFQNLNDQTSSIRLGPDTGVTLFKHFNFRTEEDKREEEIEDIVKNVPDLREGQIGDDALSSIKIFRTIDPKDVFTSYTSKLSQDYRMVGNQLEEFSSYRTMLRFEPGAGEIEVSATDLTQIEVEGTTYDIDEARSVTISPNAMNRIMITSEADGINTPGLKIHTSEMAINERVVIFPNKAAHQQIAELGDDALWNATDAQGNLIVDRKAHTKKEVASAQNTIKRVMATVAYADDEPSESSPVQSSNRVVSGATIDNPWELKLGPTEDSNTTPPDRLGRSKPPSKVIIQENKISSDEWQQLLAQSTSSEEIRSPQTRSLQSSSSLGTSRAFATKRVFGRIGKKIKDAIKKAASVVIGKVKDVVHVIVKTAEGIIDFVVDTAEKVAEFVEAVVEKVVKGIKKFIEFLQFLFDWDDILDTQRYLKRTINAGLESAKQLAADAKPHVTSFVDGLQEDVEDGMNQLVKKLGGKPSEVEESGFEIPEALEWFLSKLLGGSNPSDSDTPNSESGDSPLESFVNNLFEAFENAVGAGLRISEGVLDSIQALIKNPRQPEVALIVMIEAFRDAIIQSLEAIENVTLGLLDIVGAAIDLFQELLNAEIRIPFISDLLDFIGVGKLTVLNLATMVLAIPVTVTAKLVTGQNLFTNGTPVPLDLSNQKETLALANLTTGGPALSKSADLSNKANSADETAALESISDLRKDLAFTTIVTLADTVNHIINGILDLFDVPGLNDPGFSQSNGVDQFLGLVSGRIPGLLGGLEITSVVLSLASWMFSYPAQFEDSDEISKEDRREIILWSYRGCTLALDAILLKVGDFQRMRRKEKFFNSLWAILNAIDMILFSLYLAAVEEENPAIKRADISNEVFSALPNFACFVRSIKADPFTKMVLHLGHVGTDAVAAIVTATTGGILIREANKALKEAKSAA